MVEKHGDLHKLRIGLDDWIRLRGGVLGGDRKASAGRGPSQARGCELVIQTVYEYRGVVGIWKNTATFVYRGYILSNLKNGSED